MSDFDSVNRGFEQAFARRALQQALLNKPELQRQHAEQEKQKEAQVAERQAQSQAQTLEREIARQLDTANWFARAKGRLEAARAKEQASALVRKQAKEHVQAMLNNPDLKRQTPLQVNQEKLQSEQLTKRIAEQVAEVNKQLASIPGGKPITKVDKVTAENETNKLSNDEQYRTTIVTKMVALIKQRKMK